MSLSPNHGPRRDGLTPSLIVIHYTAMADVAAAKRVLCDPAREVSAHYLITRTGEISALVNESDRAWHAGAGSWQGLRDINSRSIGIELDNTGQTPFAEPMMAALEGILPRIMTRWGIPPEGVIGHSCITPGRKIDPGPRFDWARLARRGMAIWPPQLPTVAVDAAAFSRDLAAFGFSEGSDPLILQSFRLRFRYGYDGPLDGQDCAIAAWLAAHNTALDPISPRR